MTTFNELFRILFIVLCTFLIACDLEDSKGTFYPPDNEYKVTITQGVWGNVWFWEGNFMPGSVSGKITPVIREIYIYEATRHDSVLIDFERYPFIKEVNSNYFGKVISDKDGFYQVSLSPGKYSLFVKEDTLFYATILDADGHLMSVEVEANKVTKRQIDIDYKAYY